MQMLHSSKRSSQILSADRALILRSVTWEVSLNTASSSQLFRQLTGQPPCLWGQCDCHMEMFLWPMASVTAGLYPWGLSFLNPSSLSPMQICPLGLLPGVIDGSWTSSVHLFPLVLCLGCGKGHRGSTAAQNREAAGHSSAWCSAHWPRFSRQIHLQANVFQICRPQA